MNLLDYLDTYSNTSFKDMGFNEIDALVFSDFAYVDFYELKLVKEKVNREELLKALDEYVPDISISERKRNYLKIARYLCTGDRYKDISFVHFIKKRDDIIEKQFQAVTLIFKDFIFISYCGTDSTITGWKENFNMATLEMVPSEIEAIKYADMVSEKHWFKQIYLGGHSKGGRLAISAAKGMNKKNRVTAIFSFDAPNYPSSSYDNEYQKIDSKIIAFAPDESIIGRLMNEYHQKRIIRSSNKFLMQHDTFSWLIDDRSFIYLNDYSEKGSRIVNTINNTLINNDTETKEIFIETLFDLIDRLEIEKLPDEKVLLPFIITKLPSIYSEWKKTDKDDRAVVKKIAFELLKDYFLVK